MQKWLVSLLSLMSCLAMPSIASAQNYIPKGPIEAKYIADGPWAVSEITTSQSCDREGDTCRIFYPTQLGTNPLKQMTQGFKHPLIAWANGTNGPTTQYLTLLRHWASWGFVVVAPADVGTELGDTVTDATNFVIALGQNASSPFYGKIDTTRIGVSGHSQGAGTSTYLFTHRPDLFKVAVPFATPGVALGIEKNWTNPVDLLFVRSGSILFMGGDADIIADPVSALTYFLTTSNSAIKGVGILAGAGHEDLVNDLVCGTTHYCDAGKGYSTAMFMWKLQDAADGPDAFRRDTGEFYIKSSKWYMNLTNVQ